MSDAADRKRKVTGALMDVLAGAGKQSRPEGATHVSWPLVLVDAVLLSESTGDANRQDELIEAIGILLGVGVDEPLSLADAANRLSGEGSRHLIIAALHRLQGKAEGEADRLKEGDGTSEAIEYQLGLVAAFGAAIEMVHFSILPADNDQQIAELFTPADAKLIDALISGEAGPETDEHRAIRRRLWKLAEAEKKSESKESKS